MIPSFPVRRINNVIYPNFISNKVRLRMKNKKRLQLISVISTSEQAYLVYDQFGCSVYIPFIQVVWC